MHIQHLILMEDKDFHIFSKSVFSSSLNPFDLNYIPGYTQYQISVWDVLRSHT